MAEIDISDALKEEHERLSLLLRKAEVGAFRVADEPGRGPDEGHVAALRSAIDQLEAALEISDAPRS